MNSNIPQGWKKVKLGALINIVRKTYRPDKNDIRPYIGLEHIIPGGLRLVSHGWSSEVKSNKFEFRKGDILFGKLRPYFRKVLYAKFDGVCSTDIWVIRPRSGVDSRFLFYCLASWEVINACSRASNGTKMPRASWDYLENYEISLPPLSEQRKIAKILGSLDDKIELNYEMNKTLEAIAQAIFKNWFVDFEPFKNDLVYNEELDKEIPKEWKIKKISEIFNFIKGKKCNLIEERKEGYLPYLLIEAFEEGNIKYWTNERQPFVEAQDIVIVADGERSGKVLRFKEGILGSTLLMLKQKDSSVDVRNYAYLLLKYKEKELIKHRIGSAIPHFDKNYLANLKIIIPPSPIIEIFNKIVNPLFELIVLNQEEITTLSNVRDALLPKLLSGEIRVKVDVEREFTEETKRLEEIEEKVKLQGSLDRWLK
jgi:type I restriction enzyme S subunit